MVQIIQYCSEKKGLWDDFVGISKNGTFLFMRNYMEYHSDRFEDYSLMAFDDGDLLSILPASRHGSELRSHGGLTYGGWVVNRKISAGKMMEIFECLVVFLKERDVKKVIYKCVPHIYHSYPAEEDLYALFRFGAKLVRRDVSSAIFMPDKIRFSKGKRWGVSKASQAGVQVCEFFDYNLYIQIENECLLPHGATATHTGAELQLLADRFPRNIHLFGGFLGDKFLSGCVVYETPTVAHVQYIATTEQGREVMALERVMDFLINEAYSQKKYFSFGISTTENGMVLNEGLVSQKEMFGARTVVHDFYELEI